MSSVFCSLKPFPLTVLNICVQCCGFYTLKPQLTVGSVFYIVCTHNVFVTLKWKIFLLIKCTVFFLFYSLMAVSTHSVSALLPNGKWAQGLCFWKQDLTELLWLT